MKKSNWIRAGLAIFILLGLVIYTFVIFQAGSGYGANNIISPLPTGRAWSPFGTLFFIGIGLIMLVFLTKMIFRLFFFPYRLGPGWGMHGRHRMGWKHQSWNDETPPPFVTEWHKRMHETEDMVEEQQSDQ